MYVFQASLSKPGHFSARTLLPETPCVRRTVELMSEERAWRFPGPVDSVGEVGKPPRDVGKTQCRETPTSLFE